MLIFPMNALPWVVTGCLEALVSLTRLRRLLLFARDAPSPVPLSAGDDRRGGALLLDARGSFAFPACLEEDSALALEGTGSTHHHQWSDVRCAACRILQNPSRIPPLQSSCPWREALATSRRGASHTTPPSHLPPTPPPPPRPYVASFPSEHVVVARQSLPPAVRVASFTLLQGQLVVVCGRVGCGKSAFLQMLAGAMVPLDDDSKGGCPHFSCTSDTAHV
jgi:hypothetical protein